MAYPLTHRFGPHRVGGVVLGREQDARGRLSQSRETYLRTNKGQLFSRPANGLESQYLLTGLLTCGVCGAGIVVISREMKPTASVSTPAARTDSAALASA